MLLSWELGANWELRRWLALLLTYYTPYTLLRTISKPQKGAETSPTPLTIKTQHRTETLARPAHRVAIHHLLHTVMTSCKSVDQSGSPIIHTLLLDPFKTSRYRYPSLFARVSLSIMTGCAPGTHLIFSYSYSQFITPVD